MGAEAQLESERLPRNRVGPLGPRPEEPAINWARCVSPGSISALTPAEAHDLICRASKVDHPDRALPTVAHDLGDRHLRKNRADRGRSRRRGEPTLMR